MKRIVTFSTKERRKRRVAAKLAGSNLPQLMVFRSNKRIYAQVIDRKQNKVLAWENDLKLKSEKKMTKTERAKEVGLRLAKKLLKLGITQLVFNRSYYHYGGRVKALVEEVRKGGIKI